MQESPTVSQPTSGSWIFTSMRRLQLSTWPKRHVRDSEWPIPYPPASHSYTMLICLNDLFACLGLAQTRKLLTNFSKNSFYLLLEPLRLGYFLTNYCLFLYYKTWKVFIDAHILMYLLLYFQVILYSFQDWLLGGAWLYVCYNHSEYFLVQSL